MGGFHIDLLKSSGEFEPSSVLFEEFKITLLPNGSSVIYSFNKQIEYLLCQALFYVLGTGVDKQGLPSRSFYSAIGGGPGQ